MAMERKDPLPPGVYWMDLIGLGRVLNFTSWKGSNRGTVKMLKKKEDSFDQWWVLFEVTAPTKRWPVAAGLGLPTIARKGKTTTFKSTEKVPKVKSATELLTDWGSSTIKGAVALFVLAYVLGNRRS